MIIAVASGKGGTGKTLVATNLALSATKNSKVGFFDLDVGAPNAHIFLAPKIEERLAVNIPVPSFELSRCDFCGICSEVCLFNAIAVLPEEVVCFTEMCHGCGVCSYFCPAKAIIEQPHKVGEIIKGFAANGQIFFCQGLLTLGEVASPQIIEYAKKQFGIEELAILDLPPGTSCQVVAGLRGADFCLLVTEPTAFGLADLKLAVELVKEMGIPSGIVINRWQGRQGLIEEFAGKQDLPVIARIPLDKRIAYLYARGEAIVEKLPEYRAIFDHILTSVKEVVGR